MKKYAFALLVLALAMAPAAFATTLTFDDLPAGTVVTNQYFNTGGVLFSGWTGSAPVIANDFAMPDSPVLSPNPPYAGNFLIQFVGGGATGVQFDSGYWDTQGSGSILVFDPAANLIASLTNGGTGVFHFDLSGYGSIGWIVFDSTNDPAGADIDNLTYNGVPEPGSLILLGTGLMGVAGTIRRKLIG